MLILAPQGTSSPLPPGKVLPLIRRSVAEEGSWEIKFQLDADTVLISLWVGELQSGTFDVSIYTSTGNSSGEEALIASFPQLTTTTSDLLLRKAAVALSTVIVRIIATGPAVFDVRAKGLGTGDSSVKIQGASVWSVGQVTVGIVPMEIVPATLTDRSGLVIKNFSSNFLYVAETSAKANSTVGYPLGAGESLAFDLQAGQSIWGVANAGTVDVRSAQSGDA